MQPTHLRVEHLDEPLGITVGRPRLSWRLPEGSAQQRAYRIVAGEWDSGQVASERCVLVTYGGPPLQPRQRTQWRVKVWTDLGESNWSELGWWETGLLAGPDWKASWIAPAEGDRRPKGERPAYLLWSTFDHSGPVEQARAYATAHGIYELLINGQRVGDQELTPGFTSYRARLQVQTFDVAALIRPGRNVVTAVLSDGWYRGMVTGHHRADQYGTEVAFLLQLHIDGADGSSAVVTTGPEWQSAESEIRAADLIAGERVDLRSRVDWNDHPDRWPVGSAVAIREHSLGRLTGPVAPPVRRVEELEPASITELGGGRQVVDLGQNINGWVRLCELGSEGSETTLAYGEALDAAGDVDQDHYPVLTATGSTLGQIDRVISSGNSDCFEPRHSTKGFRYVRVECSRAPLRPADITGVVVHTDLRRSGWFSCSDDRLNQLHEVAVWSFRGNACDIPTDCPTRERAGWTGDWQVFVDTAALIYDVAGFSTKWLRDLAADQWPDGRVPNLVPDPAGPSPADDPTAAHFIGSAGWGDAAVLVPWAIWRHYGDDQLLEEQYDSMVAWVDFAARTAREKRHQSRIDRNPEPEPHEVYLWDGSFHWGEWLEPGVGWAQIEPIFRLATDLGDVGTAFLHRSADRLSKIAALLGRADDASHYRRLSHVVRDAWQREFIGAGGAIRPDTQANLVRSLAFDLIPAALRHPAADRLAKLVIDAGSHLGTGFLATPYLLPVLADSGYLALAYDLLLQSSPPSWLAMLDRGATTVWESWDGIDEHGTARESLNHYSKGAVISFLYTHVAGVRLDPETSAYRRFQVEPRPGGGLTWAEAMHDSPYGRLASSWRVDGDRFTLQVTVPAGCSARVRLPNGETNEAGPGHITYSCHAPCV